MALRIDIVNDDCINKIGHSLSSCAYYGNSCECVLIEEKASNATLKKIRFRISKGDWLMFFPDQLSQGVMSPLLKSSSEFSHHRACDAVLLIKDNDKLNVYYFDLKSGNPSGYSGQFKSTRQFIRYLIGLHNEFHKDDITIRKERFIVFYDSFSLPLRKRKTTPIIKIGESAPDNAFKIPCKNDSTLVISNFLK